MGTTQEFAINNGSFVKSTGNFTGYTAKGQRVHIYARQMESLGINKDTDLKSVLPFYCIAEEKDYSNKLDANGQPVPNPIDGSLGFSRLTALSVFTTVDTLGSAIAEEFTLKGQVQNIVREKASNAGLTESQVESLLSVAI